MDMNTMFYPINLDFRLPYTITDSPRIWSLYYLRYLLQKHSMCLLPDTMRMCRECRERYPRHRLHRKPLVSDPSMHHDTRVTRLPWCMSGSLTRDGGENVAGIPGACTTRNVTQCYGIYGNSSIEPSHNTLDKYPKNALFYNKNVRTCEHSCHKMVYCGIWGLMHGGIYAKCLLISQWNLGKSMGVGVQ